MLIICHFGYCKALITCLSLTYVSSTLARVQTFNLSTCNMLVLGHVKHATKQTVIQVSKYCTVVLSFFDLVTFFGRK